MEKCCGQQTVIEMRQPEASQLTNTNAACVRRPDTDARRAMPLQKEIERKQRWER